MTGVPYTAWEQAPFFIMLAFLVMALLAWFSRQQGAWQKFIDRRDEAWQKFLKDQRAEDQAAINELSSRTDTGFRLLTDATAKLAEALARLHSDVDVHIADENAMLNVMLNEQQKGAIERRKAENADNAQRRRKTDGVS
jgi:hypothetical protein